MITKEDLKDWGWYHVDARNFRVAQWREQEDAFYGIRHKFGNEFVDREYHWDDGPPHGTVTPIKLLLDPNAP